MARGYEGAFGRKLNAPYVWLPLCAIFVLGLFDWRRPAPGRPPRPAGARRRASGSPTSSSTAARSASRSRSPTRRCSTCWRRTLWLAFRGGRRAAPVAPGDLARDRGRCFLVGFRLGLNVADSNVIDVGYSGVIGADKIADGEPLYGDFPDDNQPGDTYGPARLLRLCPVRAGASPGAATGTTCPPPTRPRSSSIWRPSPPLFLLGRRLRPGEAATPRRRSSPSPGPRAPTPPSRSSRNTNDALVSLLLVGALLVLTLGPGPRRACWRWRR